jgi:hypothetical protein
MVSCNSLHRDSSVHLAFLKKPLGRFTRWRQELIFTKAYPTGKEKAVGVELLNARVTRIQEIDIPYSHYTTALNLMDRGNNLPGAQSWLEGRRACRLFLSLDFRSRIVDLVATLTFSQ